MEYRLKVDGEECQKHIQREEDDEYILFINAN